MILTSSDGKNWQHHEIYLEGQGPIRSVVWGKNQFIAVGGRHIITSPDGQKWTIQNELLRAELRGITYANNKYIAVGKSWWGTDNGVVLTSYNGTDWKENILDRGPLNSVTWYKNQYIAVGDFGTILTSPDGDTWTRQDSHTSAWLYAMS